MRAAHNIAGHVVAFVLGAALAIGGAFAYFGLAGEPRNAGDSLPSRDAKPGHRTVAQLVALSDAELEKTDVLEMNIAVAREIPGLEKLQYGHYRQIVDGWTDQFRRWLPTVEHGFHEAPQRYKNDINFFRLGMLAQFLDETVGIAYDEKEKRDQLQADKEGRKAEARYVNPGHLLLHGLVDTKRGTCATMPALHAAIGRRLGWPVGLACADSHFICRYDDGKVRYNIEATDTGHGGFAEGSDKDYMEKNGVSPKAVAVGCDLRKLTAREMLGVFVEGRARHYADTDRPDLAARDYALAHTLFPSCRKVYIGLLGSLLPVGEKLFARNEHGHPATFAAYLAGRYQPAVPGVASPGGPRRYRDPIEEAERVDAFNRETIRSILRPTPQPQPQGAVPVGQPRAQQPKRRKREHDQQKGTDHESQLAQRGKNDRLGASGVGVPGDHAPDSPGPV